MSADGKRLCSGGGVNDNTIKVWDLEAEFAAVSDKTRQTNGVFQSALVQLMPQQAAALSGMWSVVDEAIEQWNGAGAGTSLLLLGESSWSSYDFTLEAMPISGNGEFGVCFHAQKESMIFAVFGGWANTQHAVLGTPVGAQGPYAVLADGVAGKTELKRWHKVRAEVRGEDIRVFLEGKKLFEFQAKGYQRGAIGLRTQDTCARFRDIRITKPDGELLFECLPRVQRLLGTDALNRQVERSATARRSDH